MVVGGTRVSMLFTLPPTDATVGVWINGAFSPTSGTLVSLTTLRAPPAGSAATKRLSRRTMAIASYCPVEGNLGFATYTVRAAPGSEATDRLSNWGGSLSDS